MRKRALTGVFCLEGAWKRRLDDRASVLPTLEMLERLRIATYIHRDVGIRAELDLYLEKWGQLGYSHYEVLYFAFHGIPGAIEVGSETVTLAELAEKLDGKAEGRVVYFGCCLVMKDKDAVAEFKNTTGAKAVCGYTKKVDWLESAAFDLLLLDSLMEDDRIDARFNRMTRNFPDLTKRLGFVTHPSYAR